MRMRMRLLLCGVLAAFFAAAEPGGRAEDKIAELLGTGSDPFRFGYQANASATDKTLIPMDASQLAVGSVRVKGILALAGRPPCALVQVGTGTQLQLVREQDLILMPPDPRRRPGAGKTGPESKYLLVTGILKDSILVAPKKSPETTVAIR